MKKLVLLATFVTFAMWASAQIMINEFHYDNAGGDVGEFVEVIVPEPIPSDIGLWTITLYNGNGGASYNSTVLNAIGFGADACARYYLWELPANGLQNGAPDGIALSDASNTLVQFISYEGTFEASGGPADLVTSVDVGVAETSSTPIGASIEWDGSAWVLNDPGPDTRGAINASAAACVPPAVVPTLGEWGLIILFLSLLSFGSVFFMRRQTILAGTGGMSVSSKVPFESGIYGRILLITLALVTFGFGLAVIAFGYQLTSADIPGILISTPILAYLIHLVWSRPQK